MGIALANQRRVYIRHIVEFKENLRVLLISYRFILLASRVPMADARQLSLAACVAFLVEGLRTSYGNVLSEQARDALELSGIGRLLALTPNQEVNTLAAMHFVEFFGPAATAASNRSRRVNLRQGVALPL